MGEYVSQSGGCRIKDSLHFSNSRYDLDSLENMSQIQGTGMVLNSWWGYVPDLLVAMSPNNEGV
ncbi:hypothetical protein QJS10_CPA01g03011 [Acorus calamus]|uniref:Uncharacterized protein n=1 Tax=Acorus calamus TaxID=4465 RepID=A0AAV9FLP3_ACOCL|nr:hypothetical protein QJS10_CPA01g03011 [Acorus calamus]